MKSASIEKIQARFPAYVKAAGKGPVVVMDNAKPVAVLVSVEDAGDIERLAMGRSRKLKRLLDGSLAEIEAGKGIPRDRFWKEIEKMRKNRRTQ